MRIVRTSVGASVGAAMLLAGQLVVAGTVHAVPPVLTITADQPAAVPAGHNWAYNDFFPRRLTVHTGDTIQFALQGFHTATLLPRGTNGPEGSLANPIAVRDADDSTRNPNGTAKGILNLAALTPTSFTCGTAVSPCAYDGSHLVSSGPPSGPGPYVVRITAKPGTYSFICVIHPRMRGTIKVADGDDPGDTPASVARRVAAQIVSDRAAGFAAEAAANHARVTVDDGVRTWWLSAGTSTRNGHVAILEMLPASVNVQKGDRVAWRSRAVNEPHTVTFPGDLMTEFQPMCEGAGGVDTPATPLHIPPQGMFDFTCGGGPLDEIELDGGNGVRNLSSPTTVADSGFMASHAEDRSIGLPFNVALATWSVKIDRNAVAGTYTYVCQIHAGMEGTLVVH